MSNKYIRIAIVIGLIGVVGLPLTSAFAQLPLPGVVQPVQDTGKVMDLICLILSWIFTAAIVLSIVIVLMAAFKYMTAAGDPEKLKTAHKMLMYVAVGVAVAILARTIPILVGSFFGQGPGGLSPCPGGASSTSPPPPGGP